MKAIYEIRANKEFMENLSYSCQLGVERIQINYKSKSKLPGGRTPHMKWVGMLVGNFELNLKETDLGGAQAFFDP